MYQLKKNKKKITYFAPLIQKFKFEQKNFLNINTNWIVDSISEIIINSFIIKLLKYCNHINCLVTVVSDKNQYITTCKYQN